MNLPEDLSFLTDDALLHRVRQNEKQALLLLFDRHAPALYSAIMSLLHDRLFKDPDPKDTAKHVLEHVITALWDARQTVCIQTTLWTYLLLEARNWISGCPRILNNSRMRHASPRLLS